jgi:hypothetical protein
MKSHRSLRGTAPVLSHVVLASLACSLALTGAAQARGGAPKAVKVADTIPPTFTVDAAPMANVNGWNNSDVTITVNATDNPGGSGVAFIKYGTTIGGVAVLAGRVFANTATFVINTEGVNVCNIRVQDNAGNRVDQTITINLDKTAPSANFGNGSPAANRNGWNNTDVSIPFTTSDNLSGVDTSSPSPAVVTGEGAGLTSSITVTDKAGNVATIPTPACNIDRTAPGISWGALTPAANGNGWNNSATALSFSGTDALSGVDTTSPVSPLAFSVEGAGQTQTVTVTDKAGNTATVTSPAVNIDMTPPTITITPANGAGPIDICGMLPPSFTTADALSGIDPGFPGMLSTAAPTLSGVGTVTTSVTGVQDLAGNVASASSTYTVVYGPSAFVLGSPFKSGAFTTHNTKVRVRFGLCPDPITGASTIETASCWLERAVDGVNLGTISFDPLGLDYRLDVLGLNAWPRGSYQLLIHMDDGSIHPLTLTLN